MADLASVGGNAERGGDPTHNVVARLRSNIYIVVLRLQHIQAISIPLAFSSLNMSPSQHLEDLL
jgi:hypothetical protein